MVLRALHADRPNGRIFLLWYEIAKPLKQVRGAGVIFQQSAHKISS